MNPRTELTVAKVCALDPALGQQYDLNANGYPTVAWARPDGNLAFFASNIEGDSGVDIAVVPTADESTVQYFARCSWPTWLNVPEWVQQQEQTPGSPSAAQLGSQAYLQEVMPTNQALANIVLSDYTYSPGTYVCSFDTSAECTYY